MVNINKTKIMVFRNGGILRKNLKFTYDGNVVEIVKKFTYLGVVFTTGGSFYETHESLSGQALKAIFKLKAYVNKFTNISISHMLDLFDKLILPILTYGSEVSGFSKGDSIERIHLQFCKHLLGVKIQTQNDFIYGELGRVPVRIHRVLAALRFLFKTLHSKDTKYIRLVYNLMIDDLDNSPEKLSWAKLVKTVLETLGFGHVWLSQGVGDVNMFLAVFKRRLTDNFIQDWNEDIEKSSRANTYRFLADFSFKCYLDFVTVRKFRYAFTRLRVASHRLEIEAGRWHKPNKIPVEDRKCFICNRLENEYHFILECPLYEEIRKNIYQTLFLEKTKCT